MAWDVANDGPFNGLKNERASDKLDELVSCQFCGKEFEPWNDFYGELNDDACRKCDASYEAGQFDDRELG